MQIGSVQLGSIKATYPASLGAASPLKQASFDPADTNQDGVVSAVEKLAYEQAHPQAYGVRKSSSDATSAFAHYDPMDSNKDGAVAQMERVSYALTHPSASTGSPYAHYDPADTDKDGIVSPMEKLQYALKHPEAAQADYTAQGTLSAPETAFRKLLDIYA